MDLAELLIGVAVGLCTGLAGWWIVTRGITPRITISAEISKLPDNGPDARWRYRVKFLNEKRRWFPDAAAIDLRVTAWISIRGLRADAPTSWYRLNVPIGDTGENAYMQRQIALRLRIHDITERQHHLLPPFMRDQVLSGEIELESLLALGSKSRLRVVVTGSHAYTFGRSVAMRDFHIRDIRCGAFERNGARVVVDASRCDDATRSANAAPGRYRLVPMRHDESI